MKRERVFIWVVGVHVLFVVGMFVARLISSWMREEPEEMVTTVSFGPPPQQMVVEPPPPVRAEEPDPEPEPVREPEPVEEADSVQEPEPELEEPAWKPVRTEDIERSTKRRRVQRRDPEPEPEPERRQELTRDQLDRWAPEERPERRPERPQQVNSSELTRLYGVIQGLMYNAWRQPEGVSAQSGFVVEVGITVHRSGSITNHRLVRSSGHAEMDRTALAGARQVRFTSGIPANFPASRDVTIAFRVQ